jgi:hypothetical protein
MAISSVVNTSSTGATLGSFSVKSAPVEEGSFADTLLKNELTSVLNNIELIKNAIATLQSPNDDFVKTQQLKIKELEVTASDLRKKLGISGPKIPDGNTFTAKKVDGIRAPQSTIAPTITIKNPETPQLATVVYTKPPVQTVHITEEIIPAFSTAQDTPELKETITNAEEANVVRTTEILEGHSDKMLAGTAVNALATTIMKNIMEPHKANPVSKGEIALRLSLVGTPPTKAQEKKLSWFEKLTIDEQKEVREFLSTSDEALASQFFDNDTAMFKKVEQKIIAEKLSAYKIYTQKISNLNVQNSNNQIEDMQEKIATLIKYAINLGTRCGIENPNPSPTAPENLSTETSDVTLFVQNIKKQINQRYQALNLAS